MALGDHNRIITIEQKTKTTGSYGGPDYEWSTLTQAWANVIPFRQKEIVAGNAVGNASTIKFNILWISGVTDQITTAMRVNYNGTLYSITGVVDVYDNHQEIEITATAWTN